MSDRLRFPFIQRGLAPMSMMPIQLSRDSSSTNAMALVDSGATMNVLPYELGLELGAIWEAQDIAVRLGGSFGGDEAKLPALNATVGAFESVELIFAWTRKPNTPLILGQVNFFREFNVFFFGGDLIFEVAKR